MRGLRLINDVFWVETLFAMRHAGPETLDILEELLVEIRAHSCLTERKRGAFYKKSAGFLHFHEDPEGLFADVKVGPDWERFPVTTKPQRKALVELVKKIILESNPAE